MLNLSIGLFFGFCLGVLGSIAVGNYLIRKAEKRLADRKGKPADNEKPPVDNRKDINAQKEAYKRVKPRLDRAAEITQQQAELMAQIDQPSKNSLHSKFKNGLVAEAKKLEEEKSEILRSIIADGFDPEITVQTEEGIRQMHLSDYLIYQGYDIKKPATNNEAPPAGAESAGEPTVKKVGKFFVIKGGKNETSH